MAAASSHIVPDLENHRLQLEDKITQLRKAMRHWQQWDAEYETLKEDVEAVSDRLDSQTGELCRIKRDYDGELLQGKELEEFFGTQSLRCKAQVFNILQRQTDYMARNIENLKKQLNTFKDQLAATTIVTEPDAIDELGEPITEIIEELDDDDRVLSSRVIHSGDSMPLVQKALEKLGVGELPDGKLTVKPPPAGHPLSQKQGVQPEATLGALNGKNISSQKPVPPLRSVLPPKKNQVTFSGNAHKDDTLAAVSTSGMSRTAKRVERIIKTAKEQEEISMQKPVIPQDEEPAEAELRQQMLKYSMGEVGAVVAELQLEEGDSDDDESFDYADESFEDTDEDEEGDDGDVYERSKGSIIIDDYRRRMLELEKKLGIKSHSSHTLDVEDEDSDPDENQGIGHIVVRHDVDMTSSSSKPPPAKSNIREKQNAGDSKKGVRFSPMLDVASDDAPQVTSLVEQAQEPRVDPLGDIIERSGVFNHSGSATESKTSRMLSHPRKQNTTCATNETIPRDAPDLSATPIQENREVPICSTGMTLIDQIVERKPKATASPPDEFDNLEGYGAVASEHQRLRKKFIQRQGGFLQEDTSPVQEIDGASENLSRFKAARLSRQ